MKQVTKIEALPAVKKRTKVAAYARVSKKDEAMLKSLSAQVSHYNKYISSNPAWEFKGIYVDEGLSGTKANRAEFNRLIEDCKARLIDMVITKSISRFARNTETLLKTVRELKTVGVDVYFEEQDIHTMSSDGELILTFLASFFQEEAKSTSTNMKWKIKKSFQEGIGWGTKPCFGYDVVNKKYVVNKHEAEIVKEIFDLYKSGYGDQKTANILNERGIKTNYNGEFYRTSIRTILTNISYIGDMELQKTYRVDYLSKKTKLNKGEFDKFYCENSHEQIISKELFEEVQEIRKARHDKIVQSEKSTTKAILAGLIKCSKCGQNYRHKNTPYKEVWQCSTFNDKGKMYCNSKRIPQNKLYDCIEQVLGTKDNNIIKSKMKIVVILPDNEVQVIFKDGTEQVVAWKEDSRKDSWTLEKRLKASLKSKEQHKRNGVIKND